MKLSTQQELERLQIQCLGMINFILAVAIVASAVYSVYRLGLMIWG